MYKGGYLPVCLIGLGHMIGLLHEPVSFQQYLFIYGRDSGSILHDGVFRGWLFDVAGKQFLVIEPGFQFVAGCHSAYTGRGSGEQ